MMARDKKNGSGQGSASRILSCYQTTNQTYANTECLSILISFDLHRRHLSHWGATRVTTGAIA